jgi:hypothetical protein
MEGRERGNMETAGLHFFDEILMLATTEICSTSFVKGTPF